MTQLASNTQSKRAWPDMSAYGIHFGVLDMPNGEARMVMVDRDGAWRELAKRMGFSQSRWFGLYVKSSLKLDIPGFATNFPAAKVMRLSDQEIREIVKPLILERKNMRLSQAEGNRRLSWHPTRTAVSDAAGQASNREHAKPVVESQNLDESEYGTSAEVAAALSPQAALRQTLYLGLNSAAQEVYESGDGLRFVKSGETIIAREANDGSGPMFLRAETDAELMQVASGLVLEIMSGKHLKSGDFIRYVEAVSGVDASEDKAIVGRFHAAIDGAMLEQVSLSMGAGQDSFDTALRLHEGRPTFWREPGTLRTPLPLALVMQSLVASSALVSGDGLTPSIIDFTVNPRSHSWALNATSITDGELPRHDIALAGVFGRPIEGTSIGGVRVTRTDTAALMASLTRRKPEGLTVFAVSAAKAGKLDSEFRRVILAIAQNYELPGVIDLDAKMISPGSETGTRLIVIGRKRAAPDLAFAVASDVPVIYDYASLWSWSEALRTSQLAEIQTFGDDGREENRWQAPYIPASQVSEPEAMSPRNLLGPVRMALSRIVDRNGLGIDEFVCAKMDWTIEQLEQRLSAEQTDAVAIGIQAFDDKMAMIEADATGLGKGRVAAALAVYAKKQGFPVLFMTEKSDLFSDFYRDVEDIGCMAELSNPFILNNDLIVRDATGTKEIARSPKRDVAQVSMACGGYPAGYDIVLATYSQFNRKYDATNAMKNAAIARCIRDLLVQEADVFQILNSAREHLGLSDYSGHKVADVPAAIAFEQAAAVIHRTNGSDALGLLCESNVVLLGLSREELLKTLSASIKSDMTTLKHQWLYSGALDGAMLILDESHVAAGVDSQTGENIRFMVESAEAIAYSSATFAKDIGNFILYSRLFPATLRAATIGETLARGGEAMQEVISGMLARDGKLVRREHDLSNLEFKLSVDTDRKARNKYWAGGMAKVLASMSYLSGEVEEIAKEINEKLEESLARVRSGKTKAAGTLSSGVQYVNFSSKFYNLSRAFMMAVNADQAADLAIKALKEGRKPVITVENTMESVLRELVHGVLLENEIQADAFDLVEGDNVVEPASASGLNSVDPLAGIEAAANEVTDQVVSASKKPRAKAGEVIDLGRTVSFKDILNKYVDSMFSANKQEKIGNKVISSAKISLMTPELAEAVKEIKVLISQMPEVPLSPLDLVRDRITEAGFTVDEISGRRMRLVTNESGTHSIVSMSERKKQPIKNAFNSGSLDALVLSKSGSTGISLHASRTFSDQSQRELIELQPAADIATRLQFWGRVNRKGQVCAPIIQMVSSGLAAELRLITMQNAKLRRMSANISGNADNSALNDKAPDILNRIGNEVCYRWMEANPRVSSIIGYKIGEIPEDQVTFGGNKFVNQLTGRMLMLDPDVQETTYREITAEFNALIEQYELEGGNPLKAAEFDLRATKSKQITLQSLTGHSSVFDEAVVATELSYPIQLNALSRDEAEADAEMGRNELITKYGREFAKIIGEVCAKACDAALPSLLSKKYSTVIEALNDSTSTNAVKNAANKFGWLMERLARTTPGSILSYSAADSAEQKKSPLSWSSSAFESIYITGWKLPEKNPLSMAEYKLVGYAASTRKKVELSMSALYSRRCFVDHFHGEKNFKGDLQHEVIDSFFKSVSNSVSGHATRVVLEGNLFRAAEIAETQKQGTAITYSDDRGVWNHAILMPKTISLSSVMDLPVGIDNVDTLAAAFASRTGNDLWLTVTDDLRPDSAKTVYKLVGNDSRLTLIITGTAEKAAWLLNDAKLKGCMVNGDYKGSRGQREGTALPGKEREMMEAFMAAANKACSRVLVDGSMREWYNELLSARVASENEIKEIGMTAGSTLKAKEDKELGALLSM